MRGLEVWLNRREKISVVSFTVQSRLVDPYLVEPTRSTSQADLITLQVDQNSLQEEVDSQHGLIWANGNNHSVIP